jgi:translation elongation factor P/translation initiation factor 5A
MYDTSDIRKGLKVLLDDGNPYTIIEFQFVKPGKGAAFTRTRFKNLLSGSVIERNIRSGEKLEPANVEEKAMQFLYGSGSTRRIRCSSTRRAARSRRSGARTRPSGRCTPPPTGS